MKKAIVIGASSGIGEALARELSQRGYHVGLTARRVERLTQLQAELPNPSFIQPMDVTQTTEAMQGMKALIERMGGVDLVIINAGTGFLNPELDWQQELVTIETNVNGFVALANVAIKQFMAQKSGHLVGISSIAALRGNSYGPAYSASKAFMSNYLQALRKKVVQQRLPITVTDVQPGLVDTAIVQGVPLIWASSPEKAARQIYRAIRRRQSHVYVTKRWALFAWLLKFLPDALYHKI